MESLLSRIDDRRVRNTAFMNTTKYWIGSKASVVLAALRKVEK